MRRCLVWGVVLAACVSAHAQSASADAPANQDDAKVPVVPPALLRALGSANFTDRDAAQKQLDALSLTQRDPLEQLAASITDPEVHARLLARVAAMDDDLAIDPPLISLDVKNVSAQELAEALGRSLKIPMTASVAGVHTADRFTLKVENAAFWDVFYQLHKQNPITFDRDTFGGWILYDDGGRADTPLEIAKGFLVEVSRATPRALPAATVTIAAGPGGQLVVMQAPAAYPGGLAVRFRLTADPRLNVQAMTFRAQPSLRDDANNDLKVVSVECPAVKAKDISWTGTTVIGTPAQVGKTIKSLQVTAVLTAAVDTQRVIIEHPEQMINKPIDLGHETFTIQRFTTGGAQVSYSINVSAGLHGATMCVIDGTGKRIAFSDFRNSAAGGIAFSSDPGQFPFKLELTAARSFKEVTLPMEWHDIPIDGRPAAGGAGQGNFVVGPAGAIGGAGVIVGGDIIWNGEGGIAGPAQPVVAPQNRIEPPPLQPQVVPDRKF